jgi:pseudaminic acid cytidylyltransferase
LATIAILPARGGSKRIKSKNIIDFCGEPIIAYALEDVKKSQLFDKIHVSTDSTEIKNIVEFLGYPVDFMRPSELAGDLVGTIPVLQWVLEKYLSRSEKFNIIFNIMPAAPFLKPNDLIEAYELFLQHNKKYPLHVVSESPVPIEWAYRRDEEGMLEPIQPGAYAIRSQDLEKAYYETGPFSIFHVSHLISNDPVRDEGFISYVMPRDRAIDIDDYQDLKFAEKLFLGQQMMEDGQQ